VQNAGACRSACTIARWHGLMLETGGAVRG
jgi:hypothetical protein